MRKVVLFWVLLSVISVVLWRLHTGIADAHSKAKIAQEKIAVGMSLKDAQQALGEPYRVVCSTNASIYYMPGYSHDNYPISSRMLVYPTPPDSVLYLHMDSENKVEHVFVGRS